MDSEGQQLSRPPIEGANYKDSDQKGIVTTGVKKLPANHIVLKEPEKSKEYKERDVEDYGKNG